MFGLMNPQQQPAQQPQQNGFLNWARNMPADHRVGLLAAGLNLLSPQQAGGNTASHIASALGSGFGAMQGWQQMQAQKIQMEQQKKQQMFENFMKLEPFLKDADPETRKTFMADLLAGRTPDVSKFQFEPEEEEIIEGKSVIVGPDGQAREIHTYRRGDQIFADPAGTVPLDPLSLRPIDRSTKVNVNTAATPETREQYINKKTFERDVELVTKMRPDPQAQENKLGQIRAARALNERYVTGSKTAADLQKSLGGVIRVFGGNPDELLSNLKDINTMESLTLNFALGQTDQLPGAISNHEIQMLQNASFGVGQTGQANTMLLNLAETTIRRQNAKADFYDSWLRRYQTAEGAEDAWQTYITLYPAMDVDNNFSINSKNLSRSIWNQFIENPQGWMEGSGMTDEQLEALAKEAQR